MYKRIMMPVDLAHVDVLDDALKVGVDLAGLYEAELHLVAVISSAPSEVAHNPQEFRQKLDAFAAERGKAMGAHFTVHVIESHDPAVELDKALQQAARDVQADLVVMASHVPGFRDHLIGSHAGWLAKHTDASLFIVR